ncbi:MAG: heterodisulfide reductase-related iron-sulfur binding cluster [Candidatus Bathyarchaeia archaeon]
MKEQRIPVEVVNPVGYKIPEILYDLRQRPLEFNLEELKKRLRSIRKYTVDNLDSLLQRLERSLKRYPEVSLIYARDAEEAVEALKNVCGSIRRLSVNKSNTVEELRKPLAEQGFEIEETYYQQFEDFTPVKERKPYWQMPEVPSEVKWRSFTSNPFRWEVNSGGLSESGRVILFGINAISAEDGTIFFLEHSRNISGGLREASHMIFLVGLEKVVRNREDGVFQTRSAGLFGFEGITSELKLQGAEREPLYESRGQALNPRISIILLDNGRRAIQKREDLRELLYCIGCRTCNAVCPFSYSSMRAGEWTKGPRNWIKMFRETFMQEARTNAEMVWDCTTCKSCEAHCPLEIGQVYKFIKMREQLVEEGRGPLPQHVRFGESVKANYNPYREPHSERFAWLNETLKRKAETVYFAGCTACYREKSIAESTVKILNSLNINFGVLGEQEWCCGSPLLRTGQRRLALEVAKHNVNSIVESGAKRVVTSCAGCYVTMKEDYERLLGLKPDFDVLHISELLYSLLEMGNLTFKKGLNMVATYHDPCHLSRSRAVFLPEPERHRVYEPPRRVLQAIPELKFVEMLRSRDHAWCCGAGGGVKAASPDVAVWMATERIKEAEEAKAQVMVTACPFCVRNLRDATVAANKPVRVFDLTELVSQAL